MAYRGRLIKPVRARIYMLDTAATEANVAAGFPSGYDPIYREPVKAEDGTSSRVETDYVELRCQVRGQIGDYDRLNQGGSGKHSEFDVVLVLFARNLETAGLFDVVNGEVRLRVNCRLDSLWTLSGKLIRRYDSPQLFCTEPQDRGIGFAGQRNLIQLRFNERERTTKEALW